MATTTGAPWNIAYPQSGDAVAPLETVFATQATSVHNALNTVAAMRNTTANRPTAGVAGRYFYATDTNITWFDDGTAWKNRTPDLFVSVTSSTGVINGTVTVTWQNTVPTSFIDTGGYWSAGTPTRLTAPYTGAYRVGWGVRGNGIAPITGTFMLNGVTALSYLSGSGVGASGAASMAARTGLINLTAGQYVTIDLIGTTTQSGTHNFLMEYLGEY